MIYIDEYGNFFDAKNLTEEENKELAKMLRERAKKDYEIGTTEKSSGLEVKNEKARY
jgi:hypothetical protein